jgi:hypothetical protein
MPEAPVRAALQWPTAATLARRRRVEELRRDLTSERKNVMEQVASGGVSIVNVQNAGVVTDLPALRVEQRAGEGALVAVARPFLPEVELHVMKRHGEL